MNSHYLRNALISTCLFILLFLSTPSHSYAIENVPEENLSIGELPSTAQFIPTSNYITVHFLEKGRTFSTVYQEKDRSNEIHFPKIRDDLFALAGFDFDSELSGCVTNEVSIAINKANTSDAAYNWLAAITIRDKDKCKLFLKHFWQDKALSGQIIKTSEYRNIPVISNLKGSNDDEYQTSASSLINNNILLLSSDKKTLYNALDASQIPNQNQLENIDFKKTINQIGFGNIILIASPKSFNKLINSPFSESEIKDLNRFIATINFSKKNINLIGKLELESPTKKGEELIKPSFFNLKDFENSAEMSTIINMPSGLLNSEKEDPLKILASLILKNQLMNAKWFSQNFIRANRIGVFALLKSKTGWTLITENEPFLLTEIQEQLSKQDYNNSKINLESREINVWSKLITQKKGDYDSLSSKIDLVVEKNNDYTFWSQNLESIQEIQQNTNYPRKEKISPLAFQVYLDKYHAELQLNKLYFWKLSKAILGNSINSTIKSLSLSLTPAEKPDEISIDINSIFETE